MGLFDGILRRPRPMPVESLSSMPAAEPALSSAGLTFSGKSGICLKASGDGGKSLSKLDLTGLLAGAALPARYDLASDEYGCTWVILKGDLRNVVNATTAACKLINDAKYGRDILCIVFEFAEKGRKAYWIYNRDGQYYPFVPAENNQHDVRYELHMKDTVSGTLPVVNAVSRWFPLWGMPF